MVHLLSLENVFTLIDLTLLRSQKCVFPLQQSITQATLLHKLAFIFTGSIYKPMTSSLTFCFKKEVTYESMHFSDMRPAMQKTL